MGKNNQKWQQTTKHVYHRKRIQLLCLDVQCTCEELADLLILILGHSLAMEVDLEGEFHKKMDRVMTRKARTGKLGIRVTEYSDD